jgi:electron transport complex protein RnfE
MRELLGQGTLFDGAHLLLGSWASALEVTVFETDRSFLFAILPPGAFVGLGLLIAGKNWIDQRRAEKAKQHQAVEAVAPADPA